jgi:O-acetyl-ADP-ribose deacetylase
MALEIQCQVVGVTNLKIIIGDITALGIDAIVNAANSSLLGGGGVDGAIHRKAGPELAMECRMLNGCKTGDAKITKGYRLPAKHVIHTVGPVWQGGDKGEEAQLAKCYSRSLEIAEKAEILSIAFPAISTGIYRFPANLAARIAVSTIVKSLKEHTPSDIQFCCFDNSSAEHYQNAFAEIF